MDFEHYRICEFDKNAVLSYNAVHGTNFEPSDITKINASDLGVCDTDKYCYIMTYSFPCQDLSAAGMQRGMKKGSGTRSGLLWEVERLLTEMEERPQILLMENVPQVISDKFIADFRQWLAFLQSIGYSSKYEVLNAKNYGIPQNRERCFMVSWQGDYYYDFPPPNLLKLRLKDLLEREVDQRYYLSDSAVEKLLYTHTHTHRISGEISNAVRSSGHGSTDRHAWDSVRVDDNERDCQKHGTCAHADGTGLQRHREVRDGRSSGKRGGQDADGIYIGQSESFYRGPLKGLSRTLKAENDAGVVIHGDQL